MSRTGAQRHTHKYHKKNGLWMCALKNCTHYMPKNVESNVEGKSSLCWNCGSEFTLDEFNMINDKPICLSCSPNSDAALAFLREHGI